MIDNILGAFLVSLVVAFLVIPLIIGMLRRKNLMDIPDRRKIHRGFIPSMGGIGIVAGIAIALDRQEKGPAGVSAIREIEQAHGIRVISIISLENLVEHLESQPGMATHLANIENYRREYGAGQ